MTSETPQLAPPQDTLETGGRTSDPGTPQAAMLAWLLGLLLIAGLVFTNQMVPKQQPPTAQTAAAPAELDIFTLYSKAMVKMNAMAGVPDARAKEALISKLDQSAQSPTDRLRAALAVADIAGAAEGISRLDTLSNDPRLPEEIKAQIPLFRKVLSGDTPDLTTEEREQLVKEQGWFGELALTRGMPNTNPERAKLVSGAEKLVLLSAAAITVGVVVVLAAFACAITMIVLLATGKIKRGFVPPLPGGSVYLEMVAVFIGAFLVFKIGLPALLGLIGGGTLPDWAITATLGGQWLLLLVIFWPLVRGVSWDRFRHDIGWHSGRGVLREIGSGLFAYFAGLPLVFVALLMSGLIMVIRNAIRQSQGLPASPPENPIVDVVTHAGAAELALLFALATIWAPIVEETLFRGGFFRHLRSRVPVLLAAVVSAIAFGIMHGYAFYLLLPVISLGFVFALIREWRGSLIGSVVVHALHNATILTFAFVALSVLKD